MSEAPDLPEAEAFAAEHALGVLDARERAEAEMRMARDPAFAADVDAWRQLIAPMLDSIESVTAPQGVWTRIEAMLPANDNGAVMNKLRFWRNAAVGGFALAAASLAGVVVQVTQPPVTVEAPASAPGQLLNANLTATSGQPQPLFVAAYDPDRKALIITSLLPPGADRDKVNQLGLIAGQDKPRSLGLIEPGKAKVIALPLDVMARMSAGAKLAVSIEPEGGSKDPNGPSGPIIGLGELSSL
ncbi:MAG: anti-sigma factor domain-containing protein [Alphaproteobacteria bacterium]